MPLPFGGRKKEIIDAYRDFIKTDRRTWQSAFEDHGLFIPEAEIDNIVKSPKWNDFATWKALVSKYGPDVDDFNFIHYTLKNLETIGCSRLWNDALKKAGVAKAGELQTAEQADRFLRDICNDVPF